MEKLNVTPDQLAQSLKTAAAVLQALNGIIPQQIDTNIVAALNAIASNPVLLQLTAALLSKL